MKFLHAADLHLDSPLRGLSRYEGAPHDEVRGATRRAFANLVDLAIEESVDFVLLAGDLYDGDWRDYSTGLYFVERMAQLNEHRIPVYAIVGNHDAASQITRTLRLPANVHMLANGRPESRRLDDLGVAIHGQGYATRAVMTDLSENYPRGDPGLFNIGLLHTCLDGTRGHDPYAPCSVDGLRSKGYQYWALGHVHAREVVSRDPWILFPGNIQGRHIRESGAKGCTLVTADQGEVLAAEHRDLDVLRWVVCPVDAGACVVIDEVLDAIAGGLEQALQDADDRPVAARIVISGETAVHARLHAESAHVEQECRALAAGLGGAGAWVEKVELQTRARHRPAEAGPGTDALAGLVQAIEALEMDPRALAEIAEAFKPLRRKLPPELLGGAQRFDPTDAALLHAALDDVQAMLASRLTAAERD